MGRVIVLGHVGSRGANLTATVLLATARADTCPGDGKPCHVSCDTDEARHRCGTVQCGRNQPAGEQSK